MQERLLPRGTIVAVRAVLFLAVLMTIGACVGGAVGLPGYLIALAAADLRARRAGGRRVPPPRPPWFVVAVLLGYATVMAACGVVLTGAWPLLPWWSATAAAATAVILGRRPPAAAS